MSTFDDINEQMRQVAERRLKRIAALIAEGVPKVEIARRENISRPRLYQLIAVAKQRGIIK